MTEQELRKNFIKKLTKLLCDLDINIYIQGTNKIFATFGLANEDIEHIADRLIAAGIGDVKEAEHRAEKAEKLKNQYCRALLNLARRYVVKTNMTLPNGNEPHSRSTDIEMLALYIMANECEQAEKELAEERKDEN